MIAHLEISLQSRNASIPDVAIYVSRSNLEYISEVTYERSYIDMLRYVLSRIKTHM